MSIVNFNQRLAELEAAASRTEGKLDQLTNKLNNVKGPMDELIAQAERTGSAVGNVNGVMIEAVRMSGEVVPVLEGVMWKMYEIQKTAEESVKVSRDVLDALSLKLDAYVPRFNLWTKHVLQMAADGEMSLDQLMKKLEEMMSDPSTRQLNSLFNNDIDGFLLELRRMQDGIDEAAKTAVDAADRVEEAVERVTTSGMAASGAASTGGMGSASGLAPTGPAVTTGGLTMALRSLKGRI